MSIEAPGSLSTRGYYIPPRECGQTLNPLGPSPWTAVDKTAATRMVEPFAVDKFRGQPWTNLSTKARIAVDKGLP